MKNRLLAQLDRRLDRHGEQIIVRRVSGSGATQSYVQAHVPAIIRTLTVEQVLAGITATNYVVIISPTHLIKAQWPGGRTSTVIPGSITDPVDPRIPLINTDKLVIRGIQTGVTRVAPVFDRGECVRIEMNVAG